MVETDILRERKEKKAGIDRRGHCALCVILKIPPFLFKITTVIPILHFKCLAYLYLDYGESRPL